MATDCLEANSMQQIPVFKDEADVMSSAIEKLDLQLKKPKKVHRFYFVKFWPYKDSLEDERLIEKMDQDIIRINERYKILRQKQIAGWSQRQKLLNRPRGIMGGMEWQKMMLEHLQAALDRLNFGKGGANKSSFSKEQNTHGFKRRMLHGSSNMATERQILKEIARSQQRLNDFIDPRPLLQEYIWWYSYGNIDKARYIQMVEKMKQIEERKEKAVGDAIAKGEPWNPLSAKRAIQEQIKLVNKISMELRRESSEVMPEIVRIEKDLKAIEKEARLLIQQQRELRQRKVEAQERILNLRQQMNDRYHEYLSLLSDARELARKKDVGALRKLSQGQVKKFMSKWKTSKTLLFVE
ncbi:PREDICTED: uncharacterized protein LOC18602310 [Theobroma cacao]|uniref:Uncharacterized protein LOC18602310 n=1 Tax=Theobroma cacao TaxID=3641 RepID=A0AB32WA50_THECC|nr:PREDICTED: uncharacterized protein LOC18602310 [Theobroma cacao]